MSMILCFVPASREVLDGLIADPAGITDFIDAEMERSKDLDKAWHGIHFMLTGDGGGGAMPQATLLLGGVQIGDIDVGYGPARALSPEDTARFHEHISAISAEDFDSRFDAQAMLDQQIYPDIWDRDLAGDPDGRPYVNDFFQDLKEIFAEAAGANEGMIIFMS